MTDNFLPQCRFFFQLFSSSSSAAVSVTRVGHCDAGSKEPHQSDVDRQPRQENHGRRSPQAPVDLRTNLFIYKIFFFLIKKKLFFFSFLYLAATRTCGIGGAQAGDGRLPQKVQRQAQVKSKNEDKLDLVKVSTLFLIPVLIREPF